MRMVLHGAKVPNVPLVKVAVMNIIFNFRLCPVYCCSLFSPHNTARWVRHNISISLHFTWQVQPLPSPFTPEIARQTWNSWQEFERENLPWLYRCAGPIGLFCPGPGPDVYDLIPDLPRFPGMIPPAGDTPWVTREEMLLLLFIFLYHLPPSFTSHKIFQ